MNHGISFSTGETMGVCSESGARIEFRTTANEFNFNALRRYRIFPTKHLSTGQAGKNWEKAGLKIIGLLAANGEFRGPCDWKIANYRTSNSWLSGFGVRKITDFRKVRRRNIMPDERTIVFALRKPRLAEVMDDWQMLHQEGETCGEHGPDY